MRRAAVLLGVALLLTGLAACSSVPAGNLVQEQETPLRYWSAKPQVTGGEAAQAAFAEKMAQETGVLVEWVHPPEGQEQEAFSLMLVSNQLPDLIEYDWYHFSGGPDRAVDSKMILDLTPFLEEASPNLKALYAERQDYAAQMRSDGGYYYMYPWVRADKAEGDVMACIRQDLGLQVPGTLEEWQSALETLKRVGSVPPLVLRNGETQQDINYFAALFGLDAAFYLEGNVVKYGPYEPRWMELMQRLRNWQEQGLLAFADERQLIRQVATGSAGAAVGNKREREEWNRQLRLKLPSAVLADVPPPGGAAQTMLQEKKGVLPYGTAVSAGCKQPVLACKLMDYGYGALRQENSGDATGKQAPLPAGPAMQASSTFAKRWERKESGTLPLTYLTEKEQRDYDKIMQEITPWCRQALEDFVTGKRSLEERGAYFAKLQEMGVEKALQIRQNAYERYLDRAGAW